MTTSEQEFLSTAGPLADSLLDYARTAGQPYGITDARIVISGADKVENSVEKGEVTRAVAGKTYNVGITLYAGDRVLSLSKNTLDEKALKDAMLENMKVIHIVPENKAKRLLAADKVFTGAKKDLDLFDAHPPTTEELVQYAKDVEAAALAQPGVKTTRSVSVTKNENHVLIRATNGQDQHESRTIYSAGASVIAANGKEMQIDGERSIARHFNDMAKPKQLGKEAGLNAVSKLDSSLPDTGEMTIVLDNSAAEAFFSSVYSSINGTAIARGASFMKGKLGQQVMNAGITIEDDPAIARGLGSASVDSVGVEMKKITFVENGVLKSYQASLTEARTLGIEPIGREGGPTNTRVLPGAQTPDDLIKDIKEGIYIKGFNGGTVNVNNGLHSRQAYGNLIKDGKVTDIAVSGFVVSGNLKDMFMKAVVANDTPDLPSTKHNLAAPTTRIDGITIAGR